MVENYPDSYRIVSVPYRYTPNRTRVSWLTLYNM